VTVTEPGNGAITALAFVLGLIFGSFGTVVSYRVPRRESIVSGRSKCPNCGRQIGAADNVPLLSYLFLRGRCRACGFRIPVRYPLAEVLTGVLFAGAAWRFGLSVTAAAYAGFMWLLVVLSIIDLEHRLLPDRVVLPAIVVGALVLVGAALVDGASDRLVPALVGAVVCGGGFLLVALVGPAGGMGGGDIKLSFLLGGYLGYLRGLPLVAAGMFLSFLIGALVGIGLTLFAGAGRKTKVPFGPFLALGSILAVFFGDALIDSYVGMLG
jgi:leader peptidase (prepilin peptidase)/N-methyltransferase